MPDEFPGPGHWRSYDGKTWEKMPDPPKPSRFKRMIRYVLSPGRVALGLPVAYALVWLTNHHDVTSGLFWGAYAAWYLAGVIMFWLWELHRWAGGKSKLEP